MSALSAPVGVRRSASRHRARGAFRLALVAGLGVVGCNALSGVNDVELGGDASGGGQSAAAPCAGGGSGGAVCVDALPAGWQGPARYYSGSSAAELPACDGTPLDLGAGALDAPSATCSACACAAPTGLQCGKGTLTTHAAASCAGNTTDLTETAGDPCQPIGATNGNDWFTSAPVLTVGGKCAASGGVPTVPAATFAARIRLCGTSLPGGCPDGSTCFTAPPLPYQAKACVYKAGDAACDVPGYPTKHAAHDGVDDTRGCAPCTCAAPGGGTCSAVTELYDLPGCQTLLNTAKHDGGCTDAGGTESYLFKLTGPPVGGACIPGTTAPLGAAAPKSPFTICCAE